MDDSRLMGDALNKDKRNSKNAWVPSEHWAGGFVWHYVERANRENFLYDIRNIDGESMQYTQYGVGEFYNWHNDAGISCAYKPVSVGNRSDGLASDFLNENIELVRKLSFVVQLSDPEDYEGGNLQLLDGGRKILFCSQTKKNGYCILIQGHFIVFLKLPKDFVSLWLMGSWSTLEVR